MKPASSAESSAAAADSRIHALIGACYQCGKCTAGCPVAPHMEAPPTKIIRLLQLGDIEGALRTRSIWQCVSCQTCSTRCPKAVDCAAVMDALREMAFERGVASPAERRTVVFQKAFLNNIRRNGRLNEIELIAAFKGEVFFRDRSLPLLFQDAGLAGELQKRRKLHLRGEKVRDRGVVARIFERAGAGPR
jgi:heterodisulfide reductase subunit C2